MLVEEADALQKLLSFAQFDQLIGVEMLKYFFTSNHTKTGQKFLTQKTATNAYDRQSIG